MYYKNSFIAFFFLFFPFSFLPTDLSHPAFFGLEEHDDPKRNQDHITKELGEAVLFLGNAGEEETRLAKERRAVYNPPFCLAQRGFYWRHFRFSTLVVIYSRRGAAGYSRPRSGNLFGLLPISFFSSAFLSAFLSISLEFLFSQLLSASRKRFPPITSGWCVQVTAQTRISCESESNQVMYISASPFFFGGLNTNTFMLPNISDLPLLCDTVSE